MYEPQNGVTEGSPGEGSPGRGNAPLGKKDLAGIAVFLSCFFGDPFVEQSHSKTGHTFGR